MPSGPHYRFGPFELHVAERLLLREGRPLPLGSRAFDLLRALAVHAGEALSKEALLREVWGPTPVDEGSVRVHVAALRKLLDGEGAETSLIRHLPHLGYALAAPVTLEPAAPLPDRLLGRELFVDAVADSLQAHRLVTVVGPGGIGKTRVALAVARRLDGEPCFVDLAPLADPALVPAALAAALGAPAAGLPRLVLLDNCEHLIDAAAALVEALLRREPGVKVLATSREALRIPGEWVQRLGGLDMPEAPPASVEEALRYPALQLLVERIAAGADGFVLGEAELPAAVRLCRDLDGIPLAIELAATQVPALGLRALAELLSERLSLLAPGRRTALARHQTLRATLDWSHGLLSEAEQAVLRRLAVFRGGFSLRQALALAPCPRIDADEAADCLVRLVNKSMVVLDRAGGPGATSYRLLATTRGYALEHLQASGELEAVARRHDELARAS